MAEVMALVLDPMVQNLRHSAISIFKQEDLLNDFMESLDNLRSLLVSATRAGVPRVLNRIKIFVNHAEDELDRRTVRVLLRSPKPVICRAFDRLNFRKKAWRSDGMVIIDDLANDILLDYRYLGQVQMQRTEEYSVWVHRPRKAYPIFTREDDVVGRAANEVTNLLRSNSEALEIVSVVGRLGLRKTTLAKRVLDDPRILEEFPVREFVHVSQDYDVREILIQILFTLPGVTPEHLSMKTEELTLHVRKRLETTKYLIILDDVREREDWDKLKCVLCNNKKGSRVLITTRRKYVAAYANPCIKPYYLRSLSLEESLELLFGENDASQELREEFGHKIATKCNGVPLAILLIAGSLLYISDRYSEWEGVVDILYGGDEELCETLINWVYNHLPHRLKPCFLYLGIFPMGIEIPVSKLSRLWIAEGFIPHGEHPALEDIAEGFIPHGEHRELEDIAKGFLEELVDRNLVDVVQRKLNGRTKTCRLNGTIREFCKEKALEENIFREIHKRNEPLNQSLVDQRRICINSNLFHYFSTITSEAPDTALRSFLAFTKRETTASPEHMFFIWKSFQLLKVLDVRTFILTSFPLELWQLVLLKYLAVFGGFRSIPSKMSSLKCMQTLIVRTTQTTLEIKANIWQMMQLRHLLITNASASLPSPDREEAENENLQTLSIISPESCRNSVFAMTPCLRKLGISGKLAPFFDHDRLSRLVKLEKLKLHNTDSTRGFQSLPDVAYFPPQLKKLTLVNTRVPWSQVSTLRSLPHLETLKFKEDACEGDCWEIKETNGFPSLKLLYIGKTNLKTWIVSSAKSFPSLEALFLHRCAALESVPESVACVATLKVIDIYCTKRRLVTSVREIQERSSCEFKLFCNSLQD